MDTTMTMEKETVKKIKFGDSEIIVKQAYPYRYDYGKGKQVLRIEILEENISLAQLEALKANGDAVEYYIDDALKARYEGYTADFSYGYANATYSVEMQRVGDVELAVQQNTADIEYLSMMSGVEL